VTIKKYHHGDLKRDLIENGLLLLNNEGSEKFSLRKLASMCGVSHAAPYKHFKNKEELIELIVQEVWKSFFLALSFPKDLFPDNPKLQIVEIGKRYVRFLVEKPEYLKFIFLSDSTSPISVMECEFISQVDAFNVFNKSAANYFESVSLDPNLYIEKTLLMWSIVHGFALLISKKTITTEEDYLQLIEKMLHNYLETFN